MSPNNFKKLEEQTSVDRAFLATLKTRLLEQQTMHPTIPAWSHWLPRFAIVGSAIAIVLAVVTSVPQTQMTPRTAFAAAFERTFGSSFADFFWSGEARYTHWQIYRGGEIKDLEVWKDNGDFRLRLEDANGVYDALRVGDTRCTYAEDRAGEYGPSCESTSIMVDLATAALASQFTESTLQRDIAVTPATDTTYDVDGWVIAWVTPDPYAVVDGGAVEEQSARDTVMIAYAEGPREFGEFDVMEATSPNPMIVHSSFDVVNEPMEGGYRHAAFFSNSLNGLTYGFTFQLLENGEGSDLYRYLPEQGLELVTDRDVLFAALAEDDIPAFPIDERIFQALYFARWADTFVEPLDTHIEEVDGQTLAYYAFAAPTWSAPYSNLWKKRELLDGPKETYEFWVDESAGKIVRYRMKELTEEWSVEGDETILDTNEVGVGWDVQLLEDVSFIDALSIEAWMQQVGE